MSGGPEGVSGTVMRRCGPVVALLVISACSGDSEPSSTIAVATTTSSTATTTADLTTTTRAAITGPGLLIPSTTRVMGEETARLLDGVDSDGTLHFAGVDEFVASLAPGEVIVTGVSLATPNGLLRTVRTVEFDGSGATVFTEGALLTDAVHRGSFAFSGALDAGDIAETSMTMSGVTVLPLTPRASGATGFRAAPRGLTTHAALAGIAYSFDTDLGTGGLLQATGSASISPIIELSGSISCDDTADVPFVGEVCAEIPDLNFSVGLGAQQATNLSIAATGAVGFSKRVEIGTHHFVPITIAIGPVPLVLTPSVTVYLLGNGSLSATLSYAVHQSLDLVAGFSYNSDTGFADASRKEANFTQSNPSFAGSLQAKGMLGVQFDVRLYGIVGPYAALEGGIDFKADPAGMAAYNTSRWQVDGCLRLLVGIDSIDVIDLRYEKELFKACTEFDRGPPNSNPNVTLSYPTPGTQVYAGASVPLVAQALDIDGDTLTCVWTSSVAADAFPVTGCSGVNGSFATAGSRTLTVTVSDGYLSVSDAVTVTVAEPQAITVNISTPQTFTELDPGAPATLTGSAVGGTPPYYTLWVVQFPTTESGTGGSEHTIGEGLTLTWRPNDTIKVQNCTPYQWGVIGLYVFDSLGDYGFDTALVSFLGPGLC